MCPTDNPETAEKYSVKTLSIFLNNEAADPDS